MKLSPTTWAKVNIGTSPADRRAITPCFDLERDRGRRIRLVVLFAVLLVAFVSGVLF